MTDPERCAPEGVLRLTPSERRGIRKAADLVFDSFPWMCTPQGSRYWGRVYQNLNALADSEPPKGEA